MVVQGPLVNGCCEKISLQIKDFKFSIKLQKSIEKNDGVKGGTLVPLPTVSDSGGKGKRSSRISSEKKN